MAADSQSARDSLDPPSPGTLAAAPMLAARLQAIVAASEDLIATCDLAGHILTWNTAASRMVGLPEATAIGTPFGALFTTGGASVWSASLARLQGGEATIEMQTRLVTTRGSSIAVALAMSALAPSGSLEAVSVIARDLSEQEAAMETLAQAAERLREGESLAHVGGWAWDMATDAVEWSEEMHRVAGLSPRDFGGSLGDHLAVFDDRDLHAVESGMRRAAHGETVEGEFRLHGGDRERWVYTRARPILGPDGVGVGVHGICQDVTARRLGEEAMRVALELERAAAEELRRADRMKDDFVAIVSHELRTPLTSILGFARLLLEGTHPTDVLIEPIVRNAAEMQAMIERLLDFARSQAGSVAVEPRSLRLRELVERVAPLLAEVADDGIVIDIDIDPDLEVAADAYALERVLTNLLGNAAKYSRSGSPIEVRAVPAPDRAEVVVSVLDRGPGVEEPHRDAVFDSYYQGPAQPVGRRGAGVGLSIVRRFVELNGGRVWYEPRPGGGADFSFTVPAPPQG